MHIKNIVAAGKPLRQARSVLVMVHGRGAAARDILGLAGHLEVADFALLAPQATGGTWYPYSFLAPPPQNEPELSSALYLLHNLTEEIMQHGIAADHIYLLGFSQGACLTLEFAARHARRWGGIIAFTGGLIGDTINREPYAGHFAGTPVFMGSSNPDAHVPVERVYATSNILREMGAAVTEKIYDGMGHTIIADEIQEANKLLKGSYPITPV